MKTATLIQSKTGLDNGERHIYKSLYENSEFALIVFPIFMIGTMFIGKDRAHEKLSI
jgi:hypothetical protein